MVCLIVQGLVPFNYPSLRLESFAASCRICKAAIPIAIGCCSFGCESHTARWNQGGDESDENHGR